MRIDVFVDECISCRGNELSEINKYIISNHLPLDTLNVYRVGVHIMAEDLPDCINRMPWVQIADGDVVVGGELANFGKLIARFKKMQRRAIVIKARKGANDEQR